MDLFSREVNNNKSFFILSFTLLYIVLLPMPSFFDESMQYRFMTLMCIAISFFYLIIKLPDFSKYSLLIFLLIFLIFISVYILNFYRFRHPDQLEELIRIPVMFLFYFYAVSLINNLDFNESSLGKVFKILSIILSIQIIFIILDFTVLKEPLSYIYQKEKLTIGLDFNQKYRFIGSLENPNYLAYLACLIYPFTYFFKRNGETGFVMFILFTSLVLTILSGSRTGLIIFIIQSILLFPLYSFAFLMILGPSLILLLSSIPRFSEFFEFGSFQIATIIYNDAVNYRLANLYDAYPLIIQELWTGYGYVPFKVIDNFYIKFLLRYGLAGLFSVIFILIIFVAVYRIKAIKLLYYFIFPLLLFNLMGAFFDNFRLLLLTCIFAALWFRLANYDVLE